MADPDIAPSRPGRRGEGPVLDVRNLEAWYGESYVLHGVDFDVARGEVVTLIGRNGAGKSTTIKSLIGLIRTKAGAIRLDGVETMAMQPRQIARLGVGYVPEERGIFAGLSVEENLLLPPTVKRGGMSLGQIFELFPNLRERLASSGGKLSGGEQQMLAIGRILRTGAHLLLMDEPTEGLAPVIVDQIAHTIRRLKADGFTIVLVEQNYRFAQSFADRHYVMEQGRIVDMFPQADLEANAGKLHAYLGL